MWVRPFNVIESLLFSLLVNRICINCFISPLGTFTADTVHAFIFRVPRLAVEFYPRYTDEVTTSFALAVPAGLHPIAFRHKPGILLVSWPQPCVVDSGRGAFCNLSLKNSAVGFSSLRSINLSAPGTGGVGRGD